MCHPGGSVRHLHRLPNFGIRPPFSTTSHGNVPMPTLRLGQWRTFWIAWECVDVVVTSQIGSIGPGSAMPCFDLVVMRRERSTSMAPLELVSDSRHGRISVNGGVHIPSLRRWNEIAAKEFCMKIRINYSLCTGHGRCYSLVPDLFSADEAGLGTAIAEDLSPEQIRNAELAVQNCPEQAISLV